MSETQELLEAIQAQNAEVLTRLDTVENSVKEAMAFTQLNLRKELNKFIEELKEAMKGKKKSETADAIKELAAAMEVLGQKIDEGSLVQIQVAGQVESSLEEMREIKAEILAGVPESE